MKQVRKTGLKKLNTFQVIEQVVELTSDEGVITTKGEVHTYLKELSERLGIEEAEALFLSVFINQCDDHRIQTRDLARHFNCRAISVMAMDGVIESLVQKRIICRKKDRDGDITYRVPNTTIQAIKKGELPEKERLEGLTINEWISAIDSYVKMRENEEISDEDLEMTLEELIEKNQHLQAAYKLKGLGLSYSDLLLFFIITLLFINNNDERVRRGDISDYFDSGTFRRHVHDLEAGNHLLMVAKLVEHSCIEGQAESDSWCLTDYAKTEVFGELQLRTGTKVRSNMTCYDDIKKKELFYTPNNKSQVDQLESLLSYDKMQRVLANLAKHGMRKGFACLFYGAPGTGKTETVMQLARMTKRDIMIVDVPSIRSKWVGETEKNIKAVFDRYHRAVMVNPDEAPILLFNEADAILNKRNEHSVDSVDKMENAMQNIILQEMENLEGIMIATTNLTGMLDPAFERRFLYKVEFEKPTPKERKHIWKAMLGDLADEDALMLAEKFDFSGGQIENIARKRLISDILNEKETIDLEAIEESCKNEILQKHSVGGSIGFK